MLSLKGTQNVLTPFEYLRALCGTAEWDYHQGAASGADPITFRMTLSREGKAVCMKEHKKAFKDSLSIQNQCMHAFNSSLAHSMKRAKKKKCEWIMVYDECHVLPRMKWKSNEIFLCTRFFCRHWKVLDANWKSHVWRYLERGRMCALTVCVCRISELHCLIIRERVQSHKGLTLRQHFSPPFCSISEWSYVKWSLFLRCN